MIRCRNGKINGQSPTNFIYSCKKNPLSYLILPLTRWLRAWNAARCIPNMCGPLLDIGCGDGYFLKYIKFSESYGFDKMFFDKWIDLGHFEDHYFSYITLLAVVEHLSDANILNTELWRILKPGGYLIITTPQHKAERLIQLYAPNIKEIHKHYYDFNSIDCLLKNKYALVKYHKFLFGLNQIFCYERLP